MMTLLPAAATLGDAARWGLKEPLQTAAGWSDSLSSLPVLATLPATPRSPCEPAQGSPRSQNLLPTPASPGTPCSLVLPPRRGSESIRAALISVNACRFTDRYSLAEGGYLDQGSFGRVHRCTDNLVRISRAVKSIGIPSDPEQLDMLHKEVEALVALDHPHIVRLIELFEEGSELKLVMELLDGPTLGQRMQQEGRFAEKLAARCARHMLKALFCCHTHRIVHNDVSTENFKFLSPAPEAILKMVDFGLCQRFDPSAFMMPRMESPFHSADEHWDFAEKRDIWRAGTIMFAMLDGSELFPEVAAGGGSGSSHLSAALERLVCETDPSFVPRRLSALTVSEEARSILGGMLQLSTSSRFAAREALVHPFITRSYCDEENARLQCRSARKALVRCVLALREFHQAARLKRLALLITAHLLTNNSPAITEINWLFRYLVRDGHMVEERTMRQVLQECEVEVPNEFGEIFASADLSGKGGLHYVEFVAASILQEPAAFCHDMMLQKVFRFLDRENTGMIGEHSLQSIFTWMKYFTGGMIHEACGSHEMSFSVFKRLMVHEGWEQQADCGTAAPWADAPDVYFGQSHSALVESSPKLRVETPQPKPVNLVKSAQSEVFNVRQEPGFHRLALRTLYEAQPISNVVLGIVKGTSGYARQVVKLGLAEIVRLGSEDNGVFFFMPNPKYHWDPNNIVVREDSKMRFVAWWIHPTFVGELQAWMAAWGRKNSNSSNGSLDDRGPAVLPSAGGLLQGHAPSRKRQLMQPVEANVERVENTSLGSPGDFGFSDVQKPSDYLHTYRDLSGPKHLQMLEALVDGVGTFLEQLLGAALPAARLSAGFHYPVRPQYSTLHLQLRVNSGDVCGGTERRGVDLFKLRGQLRDDPEVLGRDDETLRYQATANLRNTVLAAAAAAGRDVREVGPHSLLLA